MKNYVSNNFLNRLPFYLKSLVDMKDQGKEYVTATEIAKSLSLNEEQVKKDLQIVSSTGGKPRVGREITALIQDIETYLGYKEMTNAIVVGAGHIGTAFINFKGFKDIGVKIIAGFDVDPKLIGTVVNKTPIYDLNSLEELLPELNAPIAILTVPGDFANEVANRLVNAGIKAIWNFVPVHLNISNDIIVENVNLASSLAVISTKLKEKYPN